MENLSLSGRLQQSISTKTAALPQLHPLEISQPSTVNRGRPTERLSGGDRTDGPNSSPPPSSYCMRGRRTSSLPPLPNEFTVYRWPPVDESRRQNSPLQQFHTSPHIHFLLTALWLSIDNFSCHLSTRFIAFGSSQVTTTKNFFPITRLNSDLSRL